MFTLVSLNNLLSNFLQQWIYIQEVGFTKHFLFLLLLSVNFLHHWFQLTCFVYTCERSSSSVCGVSLCFYLGQVAVELWPRRLQGLFEHTGDGREDELILILQRGKETDDSRLYFHTLGFFGRNLFCCVCRFIRLSGRGSALCLNIRSVLSSQITNSSGFKLSWSLNLVMNVKTCADILSDWVHQGYRGYTNTHTYTVCSLVDHTHTLVTIPLMDVNRSHVFVVVMSLCGCFMSFCGCLYFVMVISLSLCGCSVSLWLFCVSLQSLCVSLCLSVVSLCI